MWQAVISMSNVQQISPDDPAYPAYAKVQRDWQLARIAEDELTLHRAGVPPCFWLYLVVNANPATCTSLADYMGTWWTKPRAIEDIYERSRAPWQVYTDPVNFAMYHAVVDGRDRHAIRAHIAWAWDLDNGDRWWDAWLTGLAKEL